MVRMTGVLLLALLIAHCGAELGSPNPTVGAFAPGSNEDSGEEGSGSATSPTDPTNPTSPTDPTDPTDLTGGSPDLGASADIGSDPVPEPRDAGEGTGMDAGAPPIAPPDLDLGAGPPDASAPGPDQGPGSEDAGAPSPAATFVEQEGEVIMEMESATIPAGSEWTMQSELSGHTGTGYLQFRGNGVCNGPANDPVDFSFELTTQARFRLHLRAARFHHCVRGQPHGSNNRCEENDRTCNSLGYPSGNQCPESNQCIRTDISNDAFVQIRTEGGDYVPFVDQPSGSVGNGIKLFGGGNNSWSWTGNNALDTNGRKWAAEWDLSPGVYRLVIHGRSQDFRIDRVLLYDVERGGTQGAADRPETRP
ncbi:MAG: hypothetical protein ACFB9M_04635 [Myxococcota bacterium]